MGLKKIKEFEDMINISNTIKGYKVNKVVFNVMILIMILLVFLIWVEYDFASIKEPQIYLTCDSSNGYCDNEFYTLCNTEAGDHAGSHDICDKIDEKFYDDKVLYNGETIGHKPSFLAYNISTIFLLLVFAAIAFNHFVFNKGYKFKSSGGKNERKK